MKPLCEDTLRALCAPFGVRRADLTFLSGGREDSDGIVYTYKDAGETRVLKIVPKDVSDESAASNLIRQIDFAGYLGEHGVAVGAPLRGADGALYKSETRDGARYFAYRMALAPGRNPESRELTDDFAARWGELTGKTHRLTKLWQRANDPDAPGPEAEIAFFTDWCHDDAIQSAWRGMGAYVRALPRADMGFIHNDNHSRNILWDGGTLTLIDFDCACRQFFVLDVMTPGQGLMFDETGGLFEPFRDADRLKRFYAAFLTGYERENHLSDAWVARIGDFIEYRRLILFTCLQDWLATRPETRASLVRMIETNPRFAL